MSKNATIDLKPGAILRFEHLHTNRVRSLRIKELLPDCEKLYALEIEGKARRMLLLWQSEDRQTGSKIYYVLYMTSKDRWKDFGKLVENGEGSFIHCSTPYQYCDLLRIKTLPEEVSHDVMKEVLRQLPEGMANEIVRISANQALKK